MSRRIYREFYLLARGEQRALILLSLLLIFSVFFRITVMFLPEREPEGLEEFEREALLIRAALVRDDSLRQLRDESLRLKQSGHSAGFPSSAPLQERSFAASPIDINRADSVQLLPLPGIGPVYAGRIIKFRDLLGGFVSPDQLGEVYGLGPEILDAISGKICIDSAAIKKLNLNSATFRDLLRHPYLDFEQVKSLVNYREYRGNIESLLELRENFILPDSVLNRIWSYLDL